MDGAERQEGQEIKLRETVKSLDSLLDIVYVEWAKRYSLICHWPQGDARWPMVQNGEIGSPYDSLGWMCQDMSDPQSIPVSLDDVELLVLRRLDECDNDRLSWKTRMADHITHNKKVRKDRQQIALDQVQDVAEGLRYMAGRVDANKLEQIMQEVANGMV